MLFFKRKKDRPQPAETPVTYRIQLSGRDYDQLTECDIALKFWLPESVEKKIGEMCSFQDTTTSDIIRQILFIHMYGRYDLFGLIERQNNSFKLNPATRYSRSMPVDDSGLPVKPVEKSVADFKVWIPARMKADIQVLAQREGKKPSLYVRQVLITHLFGHVPPEGILIDMLPPDGHIEDAPEDNKI